MWQKYHDLYLQVNHRLLQEPQGSATYEAYDRLSDLFRRYGDHPSGDVYIRRLGVSRLEGVRHQARTASSQEERGALRAKEEVFVWFHNQIYPGLAESPQIQLQEGC